MGKGGERPAELFVSGIRAVIFDCDGVMFDTTRANTAFYNSILESMGKPPLTKEQFAFAHMATADQALAMLFPEPEEQRKAQDFRTRLTYRPFLPMMEMEPDLLRLLSRLRPRFRTAVSTNRSDTMMPVLEIHGLKDFFDCVVTALDVSHPKPHPEPLQKVLEAFSLAPEQAVYIGDTAVDEQASMAARIPFICYGNPGLAAARHISSLSELFPILSLED